MTLTGIAKRFGPRPVLDGVDLAVDDGATLALLGPSGSGKSTLLRIIAGLERPDAGRVLLDGTDVTGRPPHRRGIGVVFQDQALFPHLDVGGNVAFGLRMAGRGARERTARVDEVLALVGLDGEARRDPATLSGGEAQRVALARALAPEPAVLLLDEPLAALDQLIRERLLLELRRLFDDLAVTVVSVTHDPTEAGALGHRIAVLDGGVLAQHDVAGAVLTRPASARVAGLVGHRNVGRGTVRDGEVETPWGRFPLGPGTTAAGPVDVLVRPDAIALTPTGTLRGRVRGRVFRGGSAIAVVEGDGWPALDVRADAGSEVGDEVGLYVDPAGIHVMARSP